MAESRRSEETFPAEIPTVRPERELPAQPSRANPRLNEMAEAIGGALGNASRQVQNARDRFTVIQGGGLEGAGSSTEYIKQAALDKMQIAQARVEEIKQQAGAAVAQTRIQAAAKLEEVRARASQVVEEAKNSAVRRARLARLRAARFRAERPLTLIGIIGGAAFLLGIFLRLGRDKRG